MKTQASTCGLESDIPVSGWNRIVNRGSEFRTKPTYRTPAARRFIPRATAMLLGLPFLANLIAQPVITQDPTNQVVAVGGEALFRVFATGTQPLSYQWSLNDTEVAGANQYFLRFINVQPHLVGHYTVAVTDATGSTNSQPASLSLDKEWVLYNLKNSRLPYKGVVDLEVDLDGNIWIATGLWNGFGGGGLAKFSGRDWTVYRPANSPLPSVDCTGSTLDAAGNLWISTEAGVARFDRVSQWKVVSRNQLWFPKFDREGRLWIGSSSGVWVYDSANWKRYQRTNSRLPNDFVAFIAVDHDGRKWISTHGGLAIFDDVNWTIYNRANSGLPNDTVAPIIFDAERVAWITTWGGGLARFDGSQWTVYNTANSRLPNANLEDIAIDSKGVKWIATEGGGLTRFDGTNWTTWNRANSKLPDNIVQALAFDAYENLWLGMKDGGVAVFREGGVILPVQVESLLPDGEGNLVLRWTGGQGPYQVQSRASLNAGGWEDHGALTDQQSLAVDVDVSSRFFRVKETQP